MQITLDPRSVELAERAVEAGLYDNVECVVLRALEHLLDPDDDDYPRWTPEYAAEVNRKIEEGQEDIRQGRTVGNDEMFSRLRRLIEERAAVR